MNGVLPWAFAKSRSITNNDNGVIWKICSKEGCGIEGTIIFNDGR
jgi:hypothetical protein